MIHIDSNLRFSLSLYIMICCIIYYTKPRQIFDDNRNFKKFGLQRGETIYPFWLIVLVMGIFIHYITLLCYTNYV